MGTQKDRPRSLAGAVREERLEAALEHYCQMSLDLGASAAVTIPASDVIIGERVRPKCFAPRCLRAGETPNCPPYAPDLDLVRGAMSRFSWAVLFKCDVAPIEDYVPGSGRTKADKRRTLSFHRKGSEVVCALERHAYKDGYHRAIGFGGGSCKDYLCDGLPCQFLDSGRCRFPQRARPSMEAVGMDVLSLVHQAGWKAYALLDDLSRVPCAITVGIVFVC